MVNASFVFGMDEDDETVFERTVDWAIAQGIETATFHILTPYPGTALHQRMAAAGPHPHRRTGTCTTPATPSSSPARMTPRRAGSRLLARLPRFLPLGLHLPGRLDASPAAAGSCATWPTPAAGRSSSPLWDWVIRAKRLAGFLPLLETILAGGGRQSTPQQVSDFIEPIEPASQDTIAF